MRVTCVTTGGVRLRAGERGARRYVLDRWRDELLPVHAFLVEHPDGLCLFDTGQTARAASRGYLPGWHPFLRLARFELGEEDEVAAQLTPLGLSPADVRWVVLSHLHTDHVGGIDAFARADVFVTRAEWNRARGLLGRIRGYLPQYWPPSIVPQLIDFDGPRVGPFSASYDIAGDGKLLVVPTPGHTPGHASLLVRGEGRAWMLGGDLVHSVEELATHAAEIDEFCRRESAVFLATHDPRAPELASGS